MYVSDCIGVNGEGHLTIGGTDTVELAKEYGTPLYVMDEAEIRKNCREFVSSIEDNYDGNGLAFYASKAMCCKQLCRICNEEKMGIDAVSAGEIYTALSAGVPAGKICFHGNNKTQRELCYAIENDVGRIIVDNISELKSIEKIAAGMGKRARVLLRIKPGIEAHTHEFIMTGQIDSKFGFALETGEAMDAVKEALSAENLDIAGLHCHIGSQIFEIDPFKLAAKVMLEFMAQIKAETGVQMRELNLGGGFGIKYIKNEKPPRFSEYLGEVAGVIKENASRLGIDTPYVLIEPGRSIVGAAGITLYTVGSVKNIPDVRTYISIDGGMFDNPRYILYQSQYEIVCANKVSEPRDTVVTVAGKCCESGDLIAEGTKLQKVSDGDILAVLSTGAYNFSMASNYNRNPVPPVVMVNEGKARIIVKGDSFADMARNDI